MEYIIIGILLSIGWNLIVLLKNVIEEILFCRLHKYKWYAILAGKQTKTDKGKSDAKTITNKIGFC